MKSSRGKIKVDMNRTRKLKESTEKAYWESLEARVNSCNHLRNDGLSSAVAWATQSDGIERGVCQHCIAQFSPRREECTSEQCWRDYDKILAAKDRYIDRGLGQGVIIVRESSIRTKQSQSIQDVIYHYAITKAERLIEFIAYGFTKHRRRENEKYLSGLPLMSLKNALNSPDIAQLIEKPQSTVRDYVKNLEKVS